MFSCICAGSDKLYAIFTLSSLPQLLMERTPENADKPGDQLPGERGFQCVQNINYWH